MVSSLARCGLNWYLISQDILVCACLVVEIENIAEKCEIR